MKKSVVLLAILFVLITFIGNGCSLMPMANDHGYCITEAKPGEGTQRAWEKELTPTHYDSKPDSAFLASLKPVESEPGTIRYEYTGEIAPRRETINFNITDLSQKGAAEATTSPLKILGYATAITTRPPNEAGFKYSPAFLANEEPCEFYNPDLTPMDARTRSQIAPDEESKISKVLVNGHNLRIIYEFDGLECPQIISQDLFNARTHEQIAGHPKTGRSGGHPYADFRLGCWRSFPIYWILDICHGPIQTIELDPVDGACAEFNDVHVRLLNVFDARCGFSGLSSTILDDGHEKYSFKASYRKDEELTETFIIYAVSPPRLMNSLSFEFLDADGNVIKTDPLRAETPDIGNSELRGITLDQIDRVRVVYRPNAQRIIIPIVGIPGMSDSNNRQKNLAKLRVPYMYFHDSKWMQTAIERITGFDLYLVDPRMLNAEAPLEFPIVYNDVTVGTLLDDLVNQYPGYRACFDETEKTIRLQKDDTIE